jgi:hypothetical protein
MDPDRLAGTLMATGGLLGLAGTISTFFPFSVLGVLSFAFVLTFAVLVYRKRPEARLVAAATLWFAPLGGVACVIVLWFNRSGWFYVARGRPRRPRDPKMRTSLTWKDPRVFGATVCAGPDT